LAGHVDGLPAVHHLQTNPIKLVEAPLVLYIRILTVEFTQTTLFLLFSTCKGFAQALDVISKIGELLYPYLSL
jgi:hypothetical protein